VLARLAPGRAHSKPVRVSARQLQDERALGRLTSGGRLAVSWTQLLADRRVLTLRLLAPGSTSAASQTAGQLDLVRKRLRAEATRLGARDCGVV
jgi:hypothetical protein